MYNYNVGMSVSGFLTSTILAELNKTQYQVTEKARLEFSNGDIEVREGHRTGNANAHITLKVRCGIYHEDYGRMSFAINGDSQHDYRTVSINHTDSVQTIIPQIYEVCLSALSYHTRNYPAMPTVEKTIIEHIQLTEFLENNNTPASVSVETRVTEILDLAYNCGDVIPLNIVELLSYIPGFYVGDGIACLSTTRSGSKFFAYFEDGKYVCTDNKQIIKRLTSTLELKQKLMK